MKPYRDPAYLADANGRPCISCGVADGTVVACHLTVPGMSGVGQKMPDFAVADCCRICHFKLDLGEWKTDYEHKMRLLVKTLARRLADGWRLEQ